MVKRVNLKHWKKTLLVSSSILCHVRMLVLFPLWSNTATLSKRRRVEQKRYAIILSSVPVPSALVIWVDQFLANFWNFLKNSLAKNWGAESIGYRIGRKYRPEMLCNNVWPETLCNNVVFCTCACAYWSALFYLGLPCINFWSIFETFWKIT